MPEAARVNPVLLGSLLVFQNAGAVLLMRWVRAMPGESEFNTQTAVVMQEVLKGLACVAILLGTEGTLASAWAKPLEALKTGVPALLYLLQNNMQYVAVGYLDAATYTVSYQTKTIWSGILSMVLLNRTLGLNKWLGICGLCAGVATVQIATMGDGGGGAAAAAGESDLPGGLGGRMFGLVTILAAAGVSSCAGVYFEKILKGAKASLWTRNLQLAGYSVVVGMLKLLLSPEGATLVRAANMAAAPADAAQFRGGAFFHGYTRMTCACIAMNAFGGLLVGTVIKCAPRAALSATRSPRRFRAGAPVCLLRLCVPPRPQVRGRGAQGHRARRVDRRLVGRLDRALRRPRVLAALRRRRRRRHLRRHALRRPRALLRPARRARRARRARAPGGVERLARARAGGAYRAAASAYVYTHSDFRVHIWGWAKCRAGWSVIRD